MRSLLIVLCAVAVGTMLLGCASTMPGPGQVFPGGIVGMTSNPALLNINEVYAAYPDSFTAVGMVEGTSGNINVLGIFSFGNGGYIKAVEDALSKANADGLVNCVADVRSTSILGLFSSSKTIVRGLAIKKK